MNKYILYIWVFILFSLLSCTKDLGNYNYTDLEEVEITNVADSYEVLTLTELMVSPKIGYKSGKTFIKENYSYEWFTIDSAQNIERLKLTKLSEELNLSYKVSLPARSYPYQLYLRLKDKVSGKQWLKKMKLTVRSEIGNGWLILHEKARKTQLDLLNYNVKEQSFLPYRNILDGTIIVGSPKLVYYLSTFDLFNRQVREQVYVGTDEKTYSFNVTNHQWNDFRMFNQEVVRPVEADFHAVKFRAVSNNFSRSNYSLGNDGKLMFESNNAGTSYSVGVNRLQVVGPIKISPHFAVRTFPADGQPYAIMFDVEKRRFIAHSGTGTSSMTMFSTDPSIVDPGNVGMDLLFVEYDPRSSSFYALLKKVGGQELKLLRFNTMSSVMIPIANDIVSNTNDIDKADFYCIDPNYGYLIYAMGSKVFQYDPFNRVHKELLDMGTRRISCVKFQRFIDKTSEVRYKDYANKLVVCTYDNSDQDNSGEVSFYKLGLSSLPVKESSYVGFGKIVDVSYRE